MNVEFFEAIEMIEKERGISPEYLIEKIQNAIAIAVRRDYGDPENVFVDIDINARRFGISIGKVVVEKVEDSVNQISIEEAKKEHSEISLGDIVELPLELKQFGRIAAQTAKHVIKQGIREAEKEQLLERFKGKEGEIVSANVVRVNHQKGLAIVEISGAEAVLPRSEQIPGESLVEGERIRVYISEVTMTDRGPKVMISRASTGFVERLLAMEIPEINQGIVEIRAIAREAGSRTKVAVATTDPNIDAVGTCIGSRGSRISAVINQLNGEKVDVLEYSQDPHKFLAAALAPATIVSIEIDNDEEGTCRVTVPDHQISLAIGSRGQNVRLAARLTGWKIDIKPESGYFGEDNTGSYGDDNNIKNTIYQNLDPSQLDDLESDDLDDNKDDPN